MTEISNNHDLEHVTGSKTTVVARPAPDVILVPGFLSQEKADALLARIRAKSEFRQNYIQLFGSKPIPRLEAWYGSWDYPYSNGIVLKAAPIPAIARSASFSATLNTSVVN